MTSENPGLAQRFDVQMRTSPAAIAIQTLDETISYVELHARANRLANLLRAAGMGIEAPIGLLMGKCVEHIVAQVAICKVGATCVPLHPDEPRERIAWMMRDAGTSLVITNASSRDMVPDAVRLCVDADAARIMQASSFCPLPKTGAEARSYVLYTFGPTGLSERIDVLARDIELNARLSEVWGPLLSGGRIVLE
jgi:non-ribosomal peptide synthetase component F